MPIPRSHSVPYVGSLRFTPASASNAPSAEHPTRPKLHLHRSAVALPTTRTVTSIYTPRAETEDPFSLSGFFPTQFSASDENAVEWDWLHNEDAASVVSLSTDEDDEEWNIPTPHSVFDDAEDALAGAAIMHEDKLGILALPEKLFTLSENEDADVPYPQLRGDPVGEDAVYDTLRALRARTEHARTYGAAVKNASAAQDGLFSPEKGPEDKEELESDRWETLAYEGMCTVLDFFSPPAA